MPRKPEPKPLFAVKGDFIESLEKFCQEAIFLHQQVKAALDLGCIDQKVAPMVKERLDAFERCMSREED